MKFILNVKHQTSNMIIVTGAEGFIGSGFVNKLNNKGYKNIILVDDFSKPEKNKNLKNKFFSEKIDREDFFKWLKSNHKKVEFILVRKLKNPIEIKINKGGRVKRMYRAVKTFAKLALAIKGKIHQISKIRYLDDENLALFFLFRKSKSKPVQLKIIKGREIY